ncbi:MAG: FAD-dependent oxidoreductase [Clostridia bacterium]|nr:FAD-dependent oxidoreductase [Clostridia bacterium]
MKKLVSLILCLAMLLGCVNVIAESLYTPGTYEASVQGMGGPVVVTMEFSEDAIVSIIAAGELETKGLGDVAIEQLTQAVLDAQSAEVDMVSGATVSSTAMLSAVADCINQAKGIAEEKPVVTDETADVIVVGAGAAGLSAAASAIDSGASVIVLEANSFLGGAAGTSMGNILDLNQEVFAQADRNDAALEKYAAYGEDRFPEPWKTDYKTLLNQIEEYKNNGHEKGSLVTIERVMIDHYVKGMGKDLEGNTVFLDYDMIRSGVENAENIYGWLEEYGLTTTPLMEYVSTPAGRGMGLIELLNKAANGAEIRLSTRARELVVENGKVVGVIAEDAEGNRITYHANGGVVLATGSFSSNGEMVAQYQKIGTGLTANIPSNNPAGNRGDGIVMAEAVGAELRDMGFIQTYLKGYQNLAASGEAGNVFKAAQLLVNTNAVRFADDSNQSRIVSREGNDQPDGILIAIGDSKMIEALNAQKEGFAAELISRGMAYTADSLDEMANLTGLDAATLVATVDTFNGYVDAEEDAEFGRKTFNGKVEDGPYYAAKLQLACHLTFGGLVINKEAQVLDTDETPIPGLYAAGEKTLSTLIQTNETKKSTQMAGIHKTVLARNSEKASAYWIGQY